MKLLVCILLSLALIQCDYFAGLELEPKLVEQATMAMDELKHALQKYLDCT